MLTEDLNYIYPERLVAIEPKADFRTLWCPMGATEPTEISKSELFANFQAGDVFVINDTRVLPRRVFALNGLEILFLRELPRAEAQAQKVFWEVLFPAREVGDGELFALPGAVSARLVQRGLPQVIEVSAAIGDDYFAAHGELAIPPYIQKARGERGNRPEEKAWYQTAWAKIPGSQAAPTASLHFNETDLAELRSRGVEVLSLTLHVGMGTFLPIKTQNLSDHKMHAEVARIPHETITKLVECKRGGHRVWALGTTALRALESWGQGLLQEEANADFCGETQLFIKPGYRFEVVDGLLTNFHQPKSTLLALVSAFAGRERVLAAYEWAMARDFRLFSYGDLSVWTRQ